MSTVRIEVPTSAIDAATRDRIAELTRERDEARQNISGLEQQLNESCSQLARARERADDCRDQLDEIRRELGAGPGVSALEAVKLLVKDANEEIAEERADAGKMRAQRDEATMRHAHAVAERDGARRERDEAQEALAKATASLETERIAGRVATEFWQARIATLESAIRDLAKVLP